MLRMNPFLSATMRLIFLSFAFWSSSLNSGVVFLPVASSIETPATDFPVDRLALLSFKSLIEDDPFGALATWSNESSSSLHFCWWHGVTCGNRSHQPRVIALELGSMNLTGTLSPSLGNLSFLQKLHLPENRIRGPVPRELGLLSHLQHLNLSYNSMGGMIPTSVFYNCSHLRTASLSGNNFHGKLPRNLSHCTQLKIISLAGNVLEGEIPEDISSISKLEVISLGENRLTGNIPSKIGGLPYLKELYLHDNLLTDTIPPALGNLSAITTLALANNSLEGSIPPSLWNLSSIVTLDIQSNQLVGSLPQHLGNDLQHLQLLYLNDNQLHGLLPDSWSRASNLQEIQLSHNNYTGTIPDAIGNLTALTKLALHRNDLRGVIPPSFWNLSSLVALDIQENYLVGSLPRDLGNKLQRLQILYLNDNQLQGSLPDSWPSNLEDIQLQDNNFTGTIPRSLGSLQYLSELQLSFNQLEARNAADWSFLDALTNCTSLQWLLLTDNQLGGALPRSIVNLSTTLYVVSFSFNPIIGSIPAEIGNLIGLTAFAMEATLLNGTIPFGLGSIPDLGLIFLRGNFFTGGIPSTLGNLTSLSRLDLAANELQGPIPPSLGNCPLEVLQLEYNNLTGTLPKEVVSIPTLGQFINVSNNLLSGRLPIEIGSLKNIQGLYLSNNRLSGEIPSTTGQCQVLQTLYMQNNLFEGSIPSSFSQLKGLQELDLSQNNLSGHIPEFLGSSLNLTYLNLSYNNFDGEVPKDGVFSNASAFSIHGNKHLCGGIPEINLPPCSSQTLKKKHLSAKIIVAISVAGGIFLFITIIAVSTAHYWFCKSRSQSSPFPTIRERHRKVSFAELLKATDGFSPANLIGTGSFGSVYKGIINWEDYKDIAVKVLNLQQEGASKSFMAECEAFRNVRHRNLVKILTSCSSIDFQGNDFKALVYEFMPNGSLENWLRPQAIDEHGSIRMLSLTQRLNISIDVACALSYLHSQSSTPIVHCDLKPSNVLLDYDMVAHVGDFGLARFLKKTASKSFHGSTSSVTLKGSIGYAAPEYGMANKVSVRGDVYSFGILLLEMFTGKKPTDNIFKDGLSLHIYVEMAHLPEQIAKIVDPQLLLEGREEETHHPNSMSNNETRGRTLEYIASVLRIGVLCSKESPKERMQMEEVIGELQKLRDAFLSGA